MKFTYSARLLALAALSSASLALAQEVAKPGVPQAPPEPQAAPTKLITVSGSAAVLMDYRLRDAIGGLRRTVGSATIDAGLTWYMYPGGADKTDYAEAFAKLSGTAGPATLLAGVAYAPGQQALGKWYRNGAEAAAGVYSDPGDKEDNLYLWGDGAIVVPNTPLTAKAHIGWSKGNGGLNAGRSIGPTRRRYSRG